MFEMQRASRYTSEFSFVVDETWLLGTQASSWGGFLLGCELDVESCNYNIIIPFNIPDPSVSHARYEWILLNYLAFSTNYMHRIPSDTLVSAKLDALKNALSTYALRPMTSISLHYIQKKWKRWDLPESFPFGNNRPCAEWWAFPSHIHHNNYPMSTFHKSLSKNVQWSLHWADYSKHCIDWQLPDRLVVDHSQKRALQVYKSFLEIM